VNREQIERAEKIAEFVGQQNLVKQFRRMEAHAERRRAVQRLLDNEDDEAAKYEVRMAYYEDHTERMAKARSEYMAQLIAEGVIEDTPGVRAAEFYVKPKKLKRIPNTEKTFTARQMEIALKSLENRRSA
jgi:hypothetical protein